MTKTLIGSERAILIILAIKYRRNLVNINFSHQINKPLISSSTFRTTCQSMPALLVTAVLYKRGQVELQIQLKSHRVNSVFVAPTIVSPVILTGS